MATSLTNRVISYFFLFDFYHNKDASDDVDVLPESIIYFYPVKEDIKRQKLIDCSEIVGLIQYFKYDLFSCIPKEFNYKKSLVTSENYGRHCAFLVLSKDRFTSDEANIHLTHILQLFTTLYGTLNHIQSLHPDIHQIQLYLKQTLTPIVEHVFNANRSIKNLFSAVDYAPLRRNTQRCLLDVKHLLSYLQSKRGVKNGFFAYDKRILYSTFDTDTTYYIQTILALERHLPANEINISLKPEIRLRNGVSLLRIYIRRPPSLEPILNAVDAETDPYTNEQIVSKPIKITPVLSNETEPSTINKSYSVSLRSNRFFGQMSHEDPAGSSEETTGFETDRAEDTSSPSTGTDGIISPTDNKKFNPIIQPVKEVISATNSNTWKEESLTDDQKTIYQNVRSRTGTLHIGFDEPIKREIDSSTLQDRLDYAIMETMQYDDDDDDDGDDIDSCGDCCEENAIYLPHQSVLTSFQRTRRLTITNYADMHNAEYNSSHDNHEGHDKWGTIPEKNDEIERDEFVLYVQQNSRMIFTGIIDKHLLTEEYLQELWSLIVTGIADMERDIQVIPVAGETSKHNTDVKFQFYDHTHRVQYEQALDISNSYYKIPTSDSACIAFSAQAKMNANPERKMIGLWRGNNLVSINRYLPDRVLIFCRRFQEPR